MFEFETKENKISSKYELELEVGNTEYDPCEGFINFESELEPRIRFFRTKLKNEHDKQERDKILQMVAVAVANSMNNWCGKYNVPETYDISKAVARYMFELKDSLKVDVNIASAYIIADYFMSELMMLESFDDVVTLFSKLADDDNIHIKISRHAAGVIGAL